MKTFLLALLINVLFFIHPYLSFSDPTISVTITEVNPAARTYYDLQSIGSSFMIEANPSNVQEMHACFMVSSDHGPAYTNRNIRYFYTPNGGVTWDYIGEVAQTRAGYPSLGITNDSRAIIMANSSDLGGLRSYMYVDVFAGAGTWITLDPGNANLFSPVFPVCAVNRNNNKVFFTSGNYRNACTNLNSPGTFLGYTYVDTASQPLICAVGVSATGKVGISFITTEYTNVPPGSVKFTESTDEGITWSAPVNIWTANYQTDSLAALRGLDCAYNGDTANVVFEVCKRTPDGSYNPRSISKIMFWSPNINSGIPVIVDTAIGMNGTNPINDLYTSVCRPVLGYSTDGYSILTAFCKARSDTDIAGNNYFDIYSTLTTNGGVNWKRPAAVTNISGPLTDNRYVSSSNKNSLITSGGIYHFLVLQQDSIPGSSVNGSRESISKMMFAKVEHIFGLGVSNIHSEIPEEFSLRQNYPNPFNPVTQIEFSIPRTSGVKIKIYNTIGEIVSIIVSERFIAGAYKTDFNASELSSGVYYYVMEYTEEITGRRNSIARKMVLIK